jgi:hypothetical protein
VIRRKRETPVEADPSRGGAQRSPLLDILPLKEKGDAIQGTLTLLVAGRAFLIMGDKSPKANQKHKAQEKAKANAASQKKAQQASAAKAAPKRK